MVYGDRWGGHACLYTAKLEENGKWWCKRHAPSTRNAKDKAQREKWNAQHADWLAAERAKAERERRADCYVPLLKALAEIYATVRNPLSERLSRAAIKEAGRTL